VNYKAVIIQEHKH